MPLLRSCWRRGALVLATLLLTSPLHAVAAHAALPDPPDLFQHWAACASPDDTYCIESATRDGVDMLSGDGAVVDDAVLSVAVYLLDAHSVNYGITWAGDISGALPVSMEGQDLRLVLRTGAVAPRFTSAIADRYYLSSTGNDDDGYRAVIEGTATTLNWKFGGDGNCMIGQCGDETTAADTFTRAFSGNSQDMSFWDDGAKALFGGMWIATNAQYRPTVVQYAVWPEPYWYLPLGNPHLAVDAATPTSGSFTAWVPPAYFEAIGTTATDAAATGFTTDRVDGDVTTSIPGAASIVDGGVYLRIPDLHYSTPTIEVRAHQEGDTRDTFAPDPPVPGAVTPGANRVTAGVSAPHFNGGAAVTQMTMRCAQGNYVRSTNVLPAATQISVTGLLSGVPATCTLTAKNAAGTSVSSHVHASTPAGIAAPGVPTHLVGSIVAGRTLKLTWVAPAAPGSSAVARYTVQVCKPTGCVGKGLLKTASTTKLLASLALPGWHAGRYLVRVLATNATKTGAAIAVFITLK